MGWDHDHLLDPEALADLEQRPIEDVRAQRAACVEVETGLSYLRRLIQGSLDIVGQAIEQRGADGGRRRRRAQLASRSSASTVASPVR